MCIGNQTRTPRQRTPYRALILVVLFVARMPSPRPATVSAMEVATHLSGYGRGQVGFLLSEETMLRDAISYHLNWRAWPWRISSKPMRALIFIPLRFLIRARRASLASAVLIVRNVDGGVLVQCNGLGDMCLPRLELNGWQSSAPQVESWAKQILGCDLRPVFQAVEGCCGDLRLIYATRDLASPDANSGAHWLMPQQAEEQLTRAELQFIRLIG